MSTELSTIESNGQIAQSFMPVMTIDDILRRQTALVDFKTRVLKKDTDYGTIPGTGDKPTLLKPGAEKLCTLFGLTVRFQLTKEVEDWSGRDYDGEPFFYYAYRCSLWRGGQLIAEADGSANSREAKYRWRKGERVCPECGQASIIKGKSEYGGGWLCFKKKGGCDAKFSENDPAISEQIVGRVMNPDIADSVNTLQKMSQKRALIAATLIGVNASEFFTQDEEDFERDEEDRPTSTRRGNDNLKSKMNVGKVAPIQTLMTWCEQEKCYCDANGKVRKGEVMQALEANGIKTVTEKNLNESWFAITAQFNEQANASSNSAGEMTDEEKQQILEEERRASAEGNN